MKHASYIQAPCLPQACAEGRGGNVGARRPARMHPPGCCCSGWPARLTPYSADCLLSRSTNRPGAWRGGGTRGEGVREEGGKGRPGVMDGTSSSVSAKTTHPSMVEYQERWARLDCKFQYVTSSYEDLWRLLICALGFPQQTARLPVHVCWLFLET